MIAEQHLFVILNIGSFSLISIPLASFKEDWIVTEDVSRLRPIDINLTRSSPINPDPVDDNMLPGLLRLTLAKPILPSDGPWLLTMHSFTPQWKDPTEKAVTEIYVVAHVKGSDSKKYLLSYRLQLSQVSDTDSSRAEDMQNISNEGFRQQVSGSGWRLRLVSRNRANIEIIPMNSRSISNAGRMFYLHDTFQCFTLFTDEPQPSNQLPVSLFVAPRDDTGNQIDNTVVIVEPMSGDVAVGTPDMFQTLSFVAKGHGRAEREDVQVARNCV